MTAATHTEPATVHPVAERAVIAALMRSADPGEIARLGITHDLFGLEATREAFQAIARLWADGITPDAATLRDALSDATLIELETTIGDHVSAANLPAHVDPAEGLPPPPIGGCRTGPATHSAGCWSTAARIGGHRRKHQAGQRWRYEGMPANRGWKFVRPATV